MLLTIRNERFHFHICVNVHKANPSLVCCLECRIKVQLWRQSICLSTPGEQLLILSFVHKVVLIEFLTKGILQRQTWFKCYSTYN